MNLRQSAQSVISTAILVLLANPSVQIGWAQDAPRAARSVHLAFSTPESTVFYNEVTVRQSTSGSYFMCVGFSKGYFGIQELANGKKVVLFSVWEPGKQNNPNATPEQRRVKKISSGDGVRVGRFGGEGTGGQSFYQFDWQLNSTYRFVVYARRAKERTEYAGYFYVPNENRWQHMATFSTLADGHLLRGCYSFLEDFRRNGESAKQVRRADFGNGWAKTDGKWQFMNNARFTMDATPTENVDAGTIQERFFLATGGDTKNENAKPRSKIELNPVQRARPLDLPDPFGDGAVSNRIIRVLSYNIKHGRGNDGQVDLERTASVIRRLNPDVVALQEVDNGVKRSGEIDEPELLSRLTSMPHHAFGSFFDYQDGQYGMAILSKYPIANFNNLRLPEGAEPRTSLVAKIQVSKKTAFNLADVHFYRTEKERSAQARTLLDHLNQLDGPTVVAGDFNSTPNSVVMNLFNKDWIVPDKGKDNFTFSSENPVREIDFCMIQRSSSMKVHEIEVVEEPLVSDHRPVFIEISGIDK